MTGYASAQLEASATDADSGARPARLGIEIRSVNSRFLDLSFRLPDELRAQEPGLRALVTQHLKRGKVEVRASIESEAQGLIAPPSARMLQQLNSAQDSVRAWLPSAAPLSVADALRLCAGSAASSASWSPEGIQALAQRALEDLVAAREREGKRLSAMLQDRLKQLRDLARQAAPLVPQLVDQQRQRFLERWKEAMALTEGVPVPEAAQDRALAEATAFAIRIDVAEEITRLDSPPRRDRAPAEEGRGDRQAAGLPHPGTAPRGQYPRLQVRRHGTDPHQRGHESAHRADARAGPEHRVSDNSPVLIAARAHPVWTIPEISS